MIIGGVLLEHLGIKFLLDTQIMEWDNASTPMQDPDQFDQEDALAELEHELLYMHDPDVIEAKRMQDFLDAK